MIDILNNENNEESYSQLKQILKENVKATLSKKENVKATLSKKENTLINIFCNISYLTS